VQNRPDKPDTPTMKNKTRMPTPKILSGSLPDSRPTVPDTRAIAVTMCECRADKHPCRMKGPTAKAAYLCRIATTTGRRRVCRAVLRRESNTTTANRFRSICTPESL
jgi:hypothetical protein